MKKSLLIILALVLTVCFVVSALGITKTKTPPKPKVTAPKKTVKKAPPKKAAAPAKTAAKPAEAKAPSFSLQIENGKLTGITGECPENIAVPGSVK